MAFSTPVAHNSQKNILFQMQSASKRKLTFPLCDISPIDRSPPVKRFAKANENGAVLFRNRHGQTIRKPESVPLKTADLEILDDARTQLTYETGNASVHQAFDNVGSDISENALVDLDANDKNKSSKVETDKVSHTSQESSNVEPIPTVHEQGSNINAQCSTETLHLAVESDFSTSESPDPAKIGTLQPNCGKASLKNSFVEEIVTAKTLKRTSQGKRLTTESLHAQQGLGEDSIQPSDKSAISSKSVVAILTRENIKQESPKVTVSNRSSEEISRRANKQSLIENSSGVSVGDTSVKTVISSLDPLISKSLGSSEIFGEKIVVEDVQSQYFVASPSKPVPDLLSRLEDSNEKIVIDLEKVATEGLLIFEPSKSSAETSNQLFSGSSSEIVLSGRGSNKSVAKSSGMTDDLEHFRVTPQKICRETAVSIGSLGNSEANASGVESLKSHISVSVILEGDSNSIETKIDKILQGKASEFVAVTALQTEQDSSVNPLKKPSMECISGNHLHSSAEKRASIEDRSVSSQFGEPARQVLHADTSGASDLMSKESSAVVKSIGPEDGIFDVSQLDGLTHKVDYVNSGEESYLSANSGSALVETSSNSVHYSGGTSSESLGNIDAKSEAATKAKRDRERSVSPKVGQAGSVNSMTPHDKCLPSKGLKSAKSAKKKIGETHVLPAGQMKLCIVLPSRTVFRLEVPQRKDVVGKVFVLYRGSTDQKGENFTISIADIVDVAAGGMHSLVLTKNGFIFSWGCNDEGALGRPTSVEGSDSEPGKVIVPGRAVKISAGFSHSACLLDDGRVFLWGAFRNKNGTMSLTSQRDWNLPHQLLPQHRFASIASGDNHLVLLTTKGKVYTCGCGDDGQLGRICLRSLTGATRGTNKYERHLTPGIVFDTKIVHATKIWATSCGTFIMERRTNKIFAFGLNNYNQLALEEHDASISCFPALTKIEGASLVVGGPNHTLALANNGEVHAVGCSSYGRLGLGCLESDVTTPSKIKSLSEIEDLACGGAISFAISKHGLMFSWGKGANCPQNGGLQKDEYLPISIQYSFLQGLNVLKVVLGTQHCVILAK